MEQLNAETPTAEELAQHLSALNHSVAVINKIVGDDERSEYLDKCLETNYKHVELMLEKDFIKNSGENLSGFTAAVASAKAFLV